MKLLIVLLGLLGLVAYSTQTPKLELENCEEDVKDIDKESCFHLYCKRIKNDTLSFFEYAYDTCPLIWSCENGKKLVGKSEYQHDKEFPGCCPQALCE